VRVVDANVLLHAVNSRSPHHERARVWLDGALEAQEPVGFAWTVVLAFLRLSTHPAVYARPLTTREAVDAMRDWLSRPSAVLIEPMTRHLDLLAGLLETTGAAGNLVNDAHLAAVAVENDAIVVSFDADFARFAGVRWEPPSA
jgi:toxin-antitoxin system PIN domain toxin